MPVSIVPTLKTLAWISLEVGLLPDFLLATQMLNGALLSLPLDDETKKKVQSDLFELDLALGCRLLNASDEELANLDNLPDALEALGLFGAQAALLYILGYQNVLREDGTFPEEETDASIIETFSRLASQPRSKLMAQNFLFNDQRKQVVRTTILGMTVEVQAEGDEQSIVIVQTLVGSLEVFFATVIEQSVFPHAEKIVVELALEDSGAQPTFEIDKMKMLARLRWPSDYSVTDPQNQECVQRFLIRITSEILAACFLIDNIEQLLETLFGDEAVHGRVAIIVTAGTSYNRISTKKISRLTDWERTDKRVFPAQSPRPPIDHIDLPTPDNSERENLANEPQFGSPSVDNHKSIDVRSVIDIHAWNQACWKGAGYFVSGSSEPPSLALLFENNEGARSIFERWIARFGSEDSEDQIHLSIIRGISAVHPYTYAIQIASRMPEIDKKNPDRMFYTPCRSKVMEPSDNVNLEAFLSAFEKSGTCRIFPAILREAEPDWLTELAILKADIHVKSAGEIGEHDIQSISLRQIQNQAMEED